uniref:Uncharacterized protein n=1 Tax=Craspedostauros australis TaxID=1486917 RepID=A0A7R9ZM65_9STRA|mmetsp:Transcript_192/g.513  ORF Transcript_192/g.513 Transcript_192/m.513 type:complete len:242 (+) Transcript_192:106-831(+)
MMIALASKAALCATVTVLGGSSLRNIIQTSSIMKMHKAADATAVGIMVDTDGAAPQCSIPLLAQFESTQQQQSPLSIDEATRLLQAMNRNDLLHLFLASPPPATASGTWNGLLLDNNGPIMNQVSNIMTHVLFGGIQKRWLGKRLGDTKGANRFEQDIEKHGFDVTIEPSLMQPNKASLHLKYSNYQQPISLWKTMEDELRVVPNTDGKVMIGMGCLHLTGGMRNAAPFCLYQDDVAVVKE